MAAGILSDPLEAFRCLYCATLGTLVLVRAPADYQFVRVRGDKRELPRFLGIVAVPRASARAWLATALLLVALLAAASFGTTPFLTLPLASLVALFHFAQLADSPVVHRKANTVPVILALVGVAALPTTVDAGTISTAARIVIKLLLAQVYFSAGLTKLRVSGWRWTDGQTLRYWFGHYYLRDRNRLALTLAGAPRFARFAATLTLVFELTFWLVIVLPPLAWIYLPVALLFHAATAWLLRIHYWIYLGPAYLVIVTEWLTRR